METLERLAVLDTKIDGLITTVEDINNAVNGNGKPGMKERIAVIEANQSRIHKYLVALVGSVGATLVKTFWPH